MENNEIKNNEEKSLESDEENTPIIEDDESGEVIEEISASELDDFDESLPPVTESAIEAHKNEEIQREVESERVLSEHSDKRDKDGLSFNPEFHSTDKDGNPILNQDGTLRKKRGKKLGAVNSKLNTPQSSPVNQSPAIDYRGPAKVTSQTIDGLLMGISPDFKPTDDEKEISELTWEEYYRIKDVRDIPPGVMLLGIYVSRITSRVCDDAKYPDIAEKKKGAIKMVKSQIASNKRRGFFAKLFGRKEKDVYENEKSPDEVLPESTTQNKI